MAAEINADRLRADLPDDLFVKYVVIGDEADEAWQEALDAHSLLTQLNIYLFNEHQPLKEWLGNKKPTAIVFDHDGDLVRTLNRTDAEDGKTVREAIREARP